jgi:hypothetical protein
MSEIFFCTDPVKYLHVRIQTVCALARPHVGLHADLNGRM